MKKINTKPIQAIFGIVNKYRDEFGTLLQKSRTFYPIKPTDPSSSIVAEDGTWIAAITLSPPDSVAIRTKLHLNPDVVTSALWREVTEQYDETMGKFPIRHAMSIRVRTEKPEPLPGRQRGSKGKGKGKNKDKSKDKGKGNGKNSESRS